VSATIGPVPQNVDSQKICNTNAFYHFSGIRLQPKGPPEQPTEVKTVYAGHNSISLSWTPGFDGGVRSTKYFVAYKKTEGASDKCMGGVNHERRNDWQETDCQSSLPCNVTSLEPHHTYKFKVRSVL